MSAKKKFSIRAWVSLVLALTFIAVTVSGVILYFAPPCSVADATGWTVAALTKDQWATMHVITSLVFLIVAMVHMLVYNWGALKTYMKRKAPSRLKIRWELVAALAVFAVLLAGSISAVPPFGTVMDWQDAIKDHYREQAPSRGEGGRGGGRGEGGQSQVEESEAVEDERASSAFLEDQWLTVRWRGGR